MTKYAHDTVNKQLNTYTEIKMKSAVVLMCSIIGIMAADLEEELHELHHIHDECKSNPETYVDEELLKDLASNLENPQVGAHILCESTKAGLQKPNGDLDLEVISSKVALSVADKDKVDQLVAECAIQKKSPEKSAVNLFMCFDRNGITYFHEF